MAGEPRVMCEASFTHNESRDGLSGDDSNDDFNEEEANEKGIVEETDGIQMSSTINTIEIPADLYLSKAMKKTQVQIAKLLELIQEEDAGRIRFIDIMEYGTKIKQSGWYSNDDDNPQALLKPKYAEGGEGGIYTRQNVKNCRRKMKNIPQATYIQLSVSVNTTIKKKDKITMVDIVDKLEKTGEESETISFDGGAINIPKDLYVAKIGELEFDLKTTWINQGYNFDGDSVKYKSKLTPNHTPYWEGKGVQNYTTKSELIYDEPVID